MLKPFVIAINLQSTKKTSELSNNQFMILLKTLLIIW